MNNSKLNYSNKNFEGMSGKATNHVNNFSKPVSNLQEPNFSKDQVDEHDLDQVMARINGPSDEERKRQKTKILKLLKKIQR